MSILELHKWSRIISFQTIDAKPNKDLGTPLGILDQARHHSCDLFLCLAVNRPVSIVCMTISYNMQRKSLAPGNDGSTFPPLLV